MIAHPVHLIGHVGDHWSGDEEAWHQYEMSDGDENGNACQQPEEAQPLQGARNAVTMLEPSGLHLTNSGFAIVAFDGCRGVFDIGHSDISLTL